jgi:hypothetical protein
MGLPQRWTMRKWLWFLTSFLGSVAVRGLVEGAA